MTARIQLVFDSDVDPILKRRIEYSIWHFCAFYGYRYSEDSGFKLHYGFTSQSADSISIPANYVVRQKTDELTNPDFTTVSGQRFPLFHNTSNGPIDWLAEAFEWLSGAHEYSVVTHDRWGRLRFENSIHGRYGLDPVIPYANLAYIEFNEVIREFLGSAWIGQPTPLSSDGIVLANMIDVDFLPISIVQSVNRLIKNMLVPTISYKDPRFLTDIAWQATRRLAHRKHPFASITEILRKLSDAGISGNVALICSTGNPKDANYEFNEIPPETIRSWVRLGFEISVHGSFDSLESPNKLASEFAALSGHADRPIRGNRAHYLRFKDDNLFLALEDIGADFDASCGYSEKVGFRHGAAFPFCPYNFNQEQPFRFLELPLCAMDGALYADARGNEAAAERLALLMDLSRRFGWGGGSILWHDMVLSGAQFPKYIGELFWSVCSNQARLVSGEEIVDMSTVRYREAGLVLG